MAKIKEAREAAGYTQTEMCAALGISRPTYIKYEKNPENMPLWMAEKLCSIVRCKMDDIFLPSEVN